MGMKERKEPKMTFKDPWRTGTGAKTQAWQRPLGKAKFICSIVFKSLSSLISLKSIACLPVPHLFIHSCLHLAQHLQWLVLKLSPDRTGAHRST